MFNIFILVRMCIDHDFLLPHPLTSSPSLFRISKFRCDSTLDQVFIRVGEKVAEAKEAAATAASPGSVACSKAHETKVNLIKVTY